MGKTCKQASDHNVLTHGICVQKTMWSQINTNSFIFKVWFRTRKSTHSPDNCGHWTVEHTFFEFLTYLKNGKKLNEVTKALISAAVTMRLYRDKYFAVQSHHRLARNRVTRRFKDDKQRVSTLRWLPPSSERNFYFWLTTLHW